MPEDLTTFYQLKGTLDERVKAATGLKSVKELEAGMASKKVRMNIDLLVPNPCNHTCNHCFYIEPGEKPFISPSPKLNEELEALIQHFEKDKKNTNIVFYPREITTATQLLPVYKRLDIDRVLTTASLVTPTVVSKFKETGIKRVSVSLHGNESQHKSLTGISSTEYEKTINGINLLITSGLAVSLFTTVFSENFKHISEFINYVDKIGVNDVKFTRLTSQGRGKKLDENKYLNRGNVLEFLTTLNETRLKFPDIKMDLFGMNFGPNFYSKSYFQYLAGQSGTWPNTKYLCPWIDQQYFGISLRSHDIYPCYHLLSFPELKIGKVEIEGKRVSLNIDEPSLTALNLRKNLRGICSSDCQYQEFCLGGCRGRAFSDAVRKSEGNPLYAGQDVCVTQILDEASR